jgi:hypothetical protein
VKLRQDAPSRRLRPLSVCTHATPAPEMSMPVPRVASGGSGSHPCAVWRNAVLLAARGPNWKRNTTNPPTRAIVASQTSPSVFALGAAFDCAFICFDRESSAGAVWIHSYRMVGYLPVALRRGAAQAPSVSARGMGRAGHNIAARSILARQEYPRRQRWPRGGHQNTGRREGAACAGRGDRRSLPFSSVRLRCALTYAPTTISLERPF